MSNFWYLLVAYSESDWFHHILKKINSPENLKGVKHFTYLTFLIIICGHTCIQSPIHGKKFSLLCLLFFFVMMNFPAPWLKCTFHQHSSSMQPYIWYTVLCGTLCFHWSFDFNIVCCVITVDHFNIPVIASLPHFLYADPKYLAQVEGLHPNEKEHRTDVCMEPVS